MSKFNSYIADVRQAFDGGLDIVGEFIRSEEAQTALGLRGSDLKAVDTANMAKSYSFDRPTPLSVRNFDTAFYNWFVELGTRKMPARPIQQRTIATNDDKIMDIMTRAGNAI
jgi:hypothetical protein